MKNNTSDDSQAPCPGDAPDSVYLMPEYSAMVLLVDDQVIVGHAVRTLLSEESDIDLHFCPDPAMALGLAEEVSPTVILQDLVMPNIDGLDLVRRFRGNPATANTPIIVLSSKEDPVTKRDAFAAGANDYLVKLPDKLELVARIRYHTRAYLNQIQRDEAHRAVRESQRKLLESNTKLLGLNEELEKATRVKAEFLANMSHEIRTPLTGVIGMTTILMDTPLSKEQESFVETIRSSGNALLDLINDILDFSKIEAGKLELEDRAFDLAVCIEEALELLGLKASAKQLALGYGIDPSIPAMLVGDAGRVRQVLVNLIGNAVKFTHRGEVAVHVAPSKQRDRIQFSVCDTGIGIPGDRLGKLFRSFSQVDASTTRTFGGTGLGLAISKQLCERMGGDIWVESEPGRGSTFYFTLKLNSGPAPAPGESAPSADIAGKKVLIVESMPMHREILKARAHELKMEPAAADSAAEALQMVQEGGRFDAVVISSRLPDMDAIQLADRIRMLPAGRGCKFVLMCPQYVKALHAQARTFGIPVFLHEPVRRAQFREVFGTVFQSGDTAAAAVPKSLDSSAPATRFPMRILVAEDNPVNQRVALSLLAKLGYKAEVANNGVEAIAALERQRYDIVFMDVQMPEMDGEQAARHIRSRWPDAQRPRMIAMTANAMQEDRDRCIAAGMDGYMTKPVSMQELQRTLEYWGDYILRAGRVEPAASR